jgi:acetyl-CoA carboxylase biotin carboxyl carrier protein
MFVDILIDSIKKIIETANFNNIVDLSTTYGNFKLSFKKAGTGFFNNIGGSALPISTSTTSTPIVTSKKNTQDCSVKGTVENLQRGQEEVIFDIIRSPIVGTFYRSSSPESSPFIKEGSRVTKGDTVCIVEAMKVMNELKSELNGTLVEFFVKDGSLVEYNQPIMKLKLS